MRDYSAIPVTRHKWENWDCCPQQLRIDMDHRAGHDKVLRNYITSDNGKLAQEVGLNLGEAHAAYQLAGIHGKKMSAFRLQNPEIVRQALMDYKALKPVNGITLTQYALQFRFIPRTLFDQAKRNRLEPIAQFGQMRYYAIEDIHALYKEKP